MEHLSGVDAWWLRMETPTNPMTVNGVIWFEEPLTLDRLKAKFESDLLRFRRFHQRVVGADRPFGRAHWEADPDFSIDRHVFHVDLPEPSEAALKKVLDELMSKQLDFDKPLWEAHLVDGIDGPGNALIIRVHHSLADGFSLVLLMVALIDEDCTVELPGGLVPPRLEPVDQPTADAEEGASPHRLQSVFDLAINSVRSTISHAPSAHQAAEFVKCLGRLLVMSADSSTSLKGELGTQKAAAWTAAFPLEAVKEKARAIDGTVNDVLLGVLAGAIRRVLDARGETVDGIDVRGVIPVNIRPFESRRDAFGNGFGLVFLELPAGIASSKGRFQELKRRMDVIKDSPEAFATFGLMQAVGLTPAAMQEQLVKLFHGKSTAIITNVPGPLEPVKLAGATIRDIVFFVPQSAGAGLGLSIFSYRGFVRVGVASDRNLLDDPAMLVEAYEAELRAIGIAL